MHLSKKKIFEIVLLALFILYCSYLVINPEGDFSPFVNGAEQYYYEKCEGHNTCSDDVAETIRSVGTLKLKLVGQVVVLDEDINAGRLGYLDRGWIEYITKHPQEEQEELVKTMVDIKQTLNPMTYVDEQRVRYMINAPQDKQNDIAEKIIKRERLMETSIRIVNGRNFEEEKIRDTLESIELNPNMDPEKYLNEVEIIMVYELDWIGGFAQWWNKTVYIHPRYIDEQSEKELEKLIVNEACKVAKGEEFKNEYPDRRQECKAGETYCARYVGYSDLSVQPSIELCEKL